MKARVSWGITMGGNDSTILNDVIMDLIDIREGYETCLDLIGDSHPLSGIFYQLIEERQSLVEELQAAVKLAGGLPAQNGSVAGTLKRIVTHLASAFKEDENAVLSAFHNGEDRLSSKISAALDTADLTENNSALLKKILASARHSERIAGQLDD